MVDEAHPTPIRDGCPEPEAIAAYVDGRVAGSEKAEMEAHLASCGDCYAIFAETTRSEAEAGGSKAKVVRPRFGKSWIALAVAAALVAAAVPLAQRWRARHQTRPDVAELVAAVGAERPFEPRLTGGFQFGPMKPVYRSAAPTDESWELLAAAAKIRKKSEKDDTVQTLGDLGVAQLLLGKYDDAVSTLEEASLRAQKDARILTDLSAAYLVRAKEKDRADDYPKALEAAEKATELDPKNLEAWFNRALALDELPLKGEAAKAWRDYLNRDPDSPWAGEARKRLAAIQAIPNHAEEWKKAKARMLAAAQVGDEKTLREIMPDYCQETRKWIEEELLPQWAGAELHDKPGDARQVATLLEKLARIHTSVSGDRMMAEAARVILTASDSRTLTVLARGHAEYSDGRTEYEAGDIGSSERSFAAAGRDLTEGGSPYAAWAEYFESVGSWYTKPETANHEFSVLGAFARAKNFLRLSGFASWMQATCLSQRDAGLIPSVERFQDALKAFTSAREFSDSVAIEGRICGSLAALGDSAAFWAGFRDATGHLDMATDRRRRANSLGVAVPLLSRMGFPSVAVHLASAALAGPGYGIEDAYLYLSRASINLGRRRLPGARRDLAAAALAIGRLPAGGSRDRLYAELWKRTGILEAMQGSDLARRELDDATGYFKRANDEGSLSELLLWKGRVSARAGRFDLAERSFQEGFEVFERSRVHQGEHRDAYFEQGWKLMDEAIRLTAISERRPAEALELLERGRGRDLDPEDRPFGIKALQRRIPGGIVLVYLMADDEEMLCWAVTSRALTFYHRPIEEDLREFFEHPRRRPTLSIIQLGRLYDLLLGPLRSQLRGDSEIVFLPGGRSSKLPLASLYDRTAHRFLVEDYAIATAPSGSFWVNNHPRAIATMHATPSMLVLSAANADGLPRLPGAEAEATAVAGLFPGTLSLTGKAAGKSRFVRACASAEMIHFCGHSVANSADPNLSRLCLSASRDDDGALFASEIRHLTLARTRLVMLDACDTATGEETRSEGVLSLSRSFIAAGAANVVATLWEIDDSAARDLVGEFYRQVVSGESAVGALRAAQVWMLRSGKPNDMPPVRWAGYQLIGG